MSGGQYCGVIIAGLIIAGITIASVAKSVAGAVTSRAQAKYGRQADSGGAS